VLVEECWGSVAMAYQACLSGDGSLSVGVSERGDEEDGCVCQCRHVSREVSRLVGPIS